MESIRALHRQLDDDNDGSIEPSETGDFIRGDLKKVHINNLELARLNNFLPLAGVVAAPGLKNITSFAIGALN